MLKGKIRDKGHKFRKKVKNLATLKAIDQPKEFVGSCLTYELEECWGIDRREPTFDRRDEEIVRCSLEMSVISLLLREPNLIGTQQIHQMKIGFVSSGGRNINN
eukprot:TRINITY_DN9329_c0_g2_i1.p1 TRINITY_DN9329_c0_g2~~TRINITY_DN9329_c0_g2_i1.p1  ORF type:complete len:104 (+),score=29.95 TRINITY_DN9329_c0_g2_i1:149-460(+)